MAYLIVKAVQVITDYRRIHHKRVYFIEHTDDFI